MRFDYADESDRGPYPIPRDVPIEGGRGSDGDRHVIVVDRRRCRLYELFAAYPHDGGSRWTAGSGAIWNLRSNRMRPATWTSADAAGLPILPGLARWDEVKRGRINHALRFTVPETRRDFIYPARHFASDSNDPDLPAMGQRFRLKADYPIGGFPRQARVILKALKRYGMIVADNGSAWYVTGAPNGTGTTTRCTRSATCPAGRSRSSTRASCRGPSRDAAATFSSRCSTDEVPGIGSITGDLCSSHGSAVWAGIEPAPKRAPREKSESVALAHLEHRVRLAIGVVVAVLHRDDR